MNKHNEIKVFEDKQVSAKVARKELEAKTGKNVVTSLNTKKSLNHDKKGLKD